MTHTKSHNFLYNPEYADAEPGFMAITCVAPADMAQRIIDAPTDMEHEGRSPWLWVRLANGDLLLATYPKGDMYFETELDPNRP